MAHELIRFADRKAAFAPQYFGSVDYYALLSSFATVYVDIDMPADKRFKSAHRCTIVDTRDEIMLTVPIVPPHGRHSWNETPVSTHGKWWHVHRTALESAYGRTPFFEYYIDRFTEIFDADYGDDAVSVGTLDRRCDTIVRDIIGIDNEVIYGCPAEAVDNDFRRCKSISLQPVEYYQLRADRLGFRHNMSIVDLIFNVGPEAPLYLHKIAGKFTEEQI
ncbi:MAG: WbqC family protein [Muribaculaceae bacterium]|nr:WbqC family protein [Muribaculaceae bacterium]